MAIGELAEGLSVDLDLVKKYDGLDGTELAISESQERMAVVLDPKDVEAFLALAKGENLEAAVVARVTEEPRLVMRWRGKRSWTSAGNSWTPTARKSGQRPWFWRRNRQTRFPLTAI